MASGLLGQYSYNVLYYSYLTYTVYTVPTSATYVTCTIYMRAINIASGTPQHTITVGGFPIYSTTAPSTTGYIEYTGVLLSRGESIVLTISTNGTDGNNTGIIRVTGFEELT